MAASQQTPAKPTSSNGTTRAHAPVSAHPLPSWVADTLARAGPSRTETLDDGPIPIETSEAGTRLALTTARIPAARDLPTDEFRSAVHRAYAALRTSVARRHAPNVVRIWNFIPGIHAPRTPDLDTYRIFNQGRFDAFAAALDGPGTFDADLPTATGIGHDGADLLIHMLSTAAPGAHIENPRQIPAYHYSPRFGPRPPCFARATIASLDDRRVLLVGGTSSVRAEESMHQGDLDAQLAETFENLAAVVNAALARAGVPAPEPAADALARFTHARAYVKRPADEPLVAAAVQRALPNARGVELIRAEVCRDELLVEIEGVAQL